MKIPSHVKIALNLLEKNGYEAVIVGGAVRDSLLGLIPSDYDISTQATPEEIKKVFSKYHQLDFGVKHGTITVFINHEQLEITSYRIEANYDDFRHPKTVKFVRLLELDVKRRDFTINALCYNKELIDLVGGVDDLNNKIIRAIGKADLRFFEDPLRIIRALRFSSTLGFKIDEETSKSLIDNKELLSNISYERINSEFNKLIMGKDVIHVISQYKEIIFIFIPELKESHHLDINLTCLNRLDTNPKRLASIFADLSYKNVEIILKRLKYSNQEIKDICFYVKNLNKDFSTYELIAEFLKEYSITELLNLIDLKIELKLAQKISTFELEKQKEVALKLKVANKIFKLSELEINGRDLLFLGYQEGTSIKMILNKLLNLVIQDKIGNNKQDLMEYAKSKLKNC